MNKNFFNRYKNNTLGSMPKYLQLKEAIVSAIEDGYWESGTQIPAETEITRVTPFSLGTVQKALKVLEAEGTIERRQGYGTFISKKMFDPFHCRFVEKGSENFISISPIIVGRKTIKRDTSWARLISSEDDELIQIDRIINVCDKFSVYNKFYLQALKFPYFLEIPIEKLHGVNIKKQLRKIYNIAITKSSNFISMAIFPDEICEALKIQTRTQGLLYEIISSSGKNNPVYFSELYVPPTDLKLFISDQSHPPEYWLA